MLKAAKEFTILVHPKWRPPPSLHCFSGPALWSRLPALLFMGPCAWSPSLLLWVTSRHSRLKPATSHLQHFLRLLFPAASGITKPTEQRHCYTFSNKWNPRKQVSEVPWPVSRPFRAGPDPESPSLVTAFSESPEAMRLYMAAPAPSISDCRETGSFLDSFLYSTNSSVLQNLNKLQRVSSIIYKLDVTFVYQWEHIFFVKAAETGCLAADPICAVHDLREPGQAV